VEGLDYAYASVDNIYIHHNTMFIAGTNPRTVGSYLKDVMTDITIPLHMLSYTPRYKYAEYILEQNPQITSVVGHSLGGAIAQTLVEQKKKIIGRIYGAPIMRSHDRVRSFRHVGDPVSISAQPVSENYLRFENPHSYRGYPDFYNL